MKALVYDAKHFKNDVATPVAMLMRPATIVSEWTRIKDRRAIVDVVFDYEPHRTSCGHFKSEILLIEAEPMAA